MAFIARHYPRALPAATGRCDAIGTSRRRAIARGGSPPRCAAWHRAHAESFACRGSVRGTVRGRAAHPARCHNRAAITHAIFARALPRRRDRDIAPYRHYAPHYAPLISRRHHPRALHPQNSHAITHAHFTRNICTRWLTAAPSPFAPLRGMASRGFAAWRGGAPTLAAYPRRIPRFSNIDSLQRVAFG